LAQRGLNVKVSSAGMLPRNHRPAPLQAVEAAQARGVDLVDHVSQHAHPTVLEQATWVVVFDHTNYRALCARSPQLAHRVVYLGPYHPTPQAEIADPDGHPVEVFTRTYDTIDTCLNRLIPSLPC
jgi:protein-tyrosine-phosphatase